MVKPDGDTDHRLDDQDDDAVDDDVEAGHVNIYGEECP